MAAIKHVRSASIDPQNAALCFVPQEMTYFNAKRNFRSRDEWVRELGSGN
jgi:hypothetical protein